MIVEAEGYRFDFKGAVKAFKFDEPDTAKSTFHGAPMKAVDIVAEFREEYIFVEIKVYDKQEDYDICEDLDDSAKKDRRDHFNWLKEYLKYKCRDSYLYRHAEGLAEKPIHYLCLINFDNALNLHMAKCLRNELPVGKTTPRWSRELFKSCHVLNTFTWNRNFPKWPVTIL